MNSKSLFAMCAALTTAAPSYAGEAEVKELGNAINARLAAAGVRFRLGKLEAYGVAGTTGRSVFFNERAFQIPYHYVAGDPRREWSGDQSRRQDDITCIIDGVENQTHSGLDAIPALRRAMTTWDDVPSTRIPLTDLGNAPFDLGVVQFLTTMGPPNILGDVHPFEPSGFPGPVADITHAGFLSGEWFNYMFGPVDGSRTLGVTFVFSFDDGNGGETDIDGDGKIDTAFSEIYLNNSESLNWAIDGQWTVGSSAPRDFDIETIALHEMGHALSQSHFGMAFQTEEGGPVHFAPYAVMNPAYSRARHTLTGSDIAGHSVIWASWSKE